MRVLELTRRDNVSIPEIANVIMTDPALVSKILKTVNSPYYGLAKQVSTVSNALVILGLQAAKTLALGFSLLTNLKRPSDRHDPTFDYQAFWKRSIYAAVASRVIARRAAVIQQEEAFLAGLLAHAGVLILHRIVPREFDPLLARCRGDYQKLNTLCREALGLDTAEVGSLLAEKWQLPPLLARPIALQISRDESDPHFKPLVEAVSTGLLVAEAFVVDDPTSAISTACRELSARFDMSPQVVERIFSEVRESARASAALLDLPMGRDRGSQDILHEAQEALVSLSLQSQREVQIIQRQVESLQVKASTDPLTGLANRARFDQFLEEHFKHAHTRGRHLSLVFIDIDHFKKINDTHGHQAGDEVLRRVGRLLQASVREVDLVARYGGEEFAIVLTDTDTVAAAVRAETLRARMAADVMSIEGTRIAVTFSAGVAGTDRKRIFNQAAQLTNAADRAVYAAKAAGRNCVRAFKPLVNDPVGAVPAGAPAAT